MTIGLMGGTFDPPHIGHLVAAECARHQLGLQRVLWLPAGDPYLKTREAGRRISPAEHRVAMTRLAIAGNDAFALDEREVQRQGATYTADTLEEIHREGLRDIVFILGADAFLEMPRWHAPDRIRALARLAVAPKAEVSGEQLRAAGATIIDMPVLDVSSTLVRERVRAGRSIRYLVLDAVEAYLREHGLYRAE